jgi:hypothetical protein
MVENELCGISATEDRTRFTGGSNERQIVDRHDHDQGGTT